MDRGAWKATVHRIAKSQTRLKQLSAHICMQKGGMGKWEVEAQEGGYICILIHICILIADSC